MSETVVTDGGKETVGSAADAAVLASAEAKAAADQAKADETARNIAAVKPDFAAEDARIAALPAAARAAAQTKLDADKKAATDAAASVAKPVVPEKYDLKAPEGSPLDAAFVERTAAIARELGLDQSGAEKLMAQRANEIAGVMAAYKAPDMETGQGAGAAWIARDDAFRAQALADPAFGKGDKATFETAIERAQQGLKILDPDAKGPLRALLNASGYGSHPAVLTALANLGRRGSEGAQHKGAGAGGGERVKSDAEKMYPSMFNDDGTPKT